MVDIGKNFIITPLARGVNQALMLDNPHHLNSSSHLQKMEFGGSGFLGINDYLGSEAGFERTLRVKEAQECDSVQESNERRGLKWRGEERRGEERRGEERRGEERRERREERRREDRKERFEKMNRQDGQDEEDEDDEDEEDEEDEADEQAK
ncbi:hypothetical protein EYC80_005769 [Monilinia laxa]|uniref:Uncharacterized protein n=2 Tax=Monilinia laxa TaxID=61186 RepID=A0A5N6KGD1_MONLA|nr:hypothetical protein EYC80_005769 [Monilinia laxa]